MLEQNLCSADLLLVFLLDSDMHEGCLVVSAAADSVAVTVQTSRSVASVVDFQIRNAVPLSGVTFAESIEDALNAAGILVELAGMEKMDTI